MAKITREGMPQGKPPAKIKFKCDSCFSHLETEEDEASAVPAKQRDYAPYIFGWDITCPNCGKPTFLDREEVKSQQYGRGPRY